MKKIIILTAFLVLVTFPTVVVSLPDASDGITGEGGISTVAGLLDVIEKIINYFFTALIALAVIFIILAGFSFLTASGDPLKLNKAKNQLFWALVAVAIGALSKGMILAVAKIFGVEIP
jgi:hypothetical protein